ncbi:MAG: dihydrodipicolinate synthase family protein [Actinobacteria bacterium]|nr:MAG: dihydrodipicolinate synthase family protein [Actinomycetota bacterium]
MPFMPRLPSVYVISLTPFAEDESLDERAFRAHLQRMKAAGIGVYVGGAGSGEAYTLSPAEMRRVLEIAVEELQGAVPVRAMGVEPRTAKEMITFGKLCAAVGVDAMQVYSLDIGHVGRPAGEEIERYLDDVLSSLEVPAVISTHFSVGYFVPVAIMARICDRYDHVIGINCTNPDINYLTQLCTIIDERVEIHTGLMTQALGAFAVGASGYLTTEANVVPRLCVEVVERYGAGDLSGMMAAYGRLLRFSDKLLGDGGSIRATKATLSLMGLPGGIPRRPRLPLADAATTERLQQMIDELALRETELSDSPTRPRPVS